MIVSLLSTKILVHVIDNSNNEIRGGGVKRMWAGTEKQLIKFACPYAQYVHTDIHKLHISKWTIANPYRYFIPSLAMTNW